ncbi:hypothetical protein BC2230_30614 [Burkholderia cepacia]
MRADMPVTRASPHGDTIPDDCTTARLHDCTTARLHDCTTARPYGHTAAWVRFPGGPVFPPSRSDRAAFF